MTQTTPNSYGFSPADERKLVWKLDFRLIPILGLLYLISFIDRVNIGQAKVAGMVTDLGMTSHQFQIANTIFFATYVAFEIIGNLLVKRFRPSRILPVMITLWSAILIGQAFVKNAGHLYTTRVLLGVFEAGLFPGAIYIISLYYPRQEQALRMGFLFSACVLAGAFGGVLAYGLSRIRGAGLEGWRYIYLIEGCISIAIGIASFFLVVDLPETANFLSEKERGFVMHRIKQGQGALSLDVKFSWSHVWSAFLDFKLYMFATLYFMMGALLYALSTFAPFIISQLGDWTQAESQLLTVPPFAAGFITTVASAYISDRTGKRGPIIIVGSFVSLIGYILVLVIPDHAPGAKYFSLFVMVAGFSPAAASVLAWGAGSFGPTYKRGITQGVIMSSGNTAGILSSFLYPDSDKPDFIIGHSTSAAFSFCTLVLAAVLYFILRRENKQRDRKYGTLDEIYAIINEQGGSGVEKTYTPEKDVEDVDARAAVTTRNEFVDLPPVLLETFGLHGYSRDEIAGLGDKHPMFRYLC